MTVGSGLMTKESQFGNDKTDESRRKALEALDATPRRPPTYLSRRWTTGGGVTPSSRRDGTRRSTGS
jgi:hypothetical protein